MFLKFKLFVQDKSRETETWSYVPCDTCSKKYKVEKSDLSFLNHCSHECKVHFLEKKKFKCKRCKKIYETDYENYDFCSQSCAQLELKLLTCQRCKLPFYAFVDETDTNCLRLSCYRGARQDYYNNYKRKRKYWIESLIQVHNFRIKSGYDRFSDKSNLSINDVSVDAISSDKEKIAYVFYSDYYHNPDGVYEPNKMHPELKKTFRQIMEETNIRSYMIESKGYRIGYITETKYDALSLETAASL